jgi:hypothetical protein
MSGFYDTGVEGLVDQSLNWVKDDLRVCLLRASYVFKPTHTSLADVMRAAAGMSGTITGRRAEGRALMADPTFVLATQAARVNQVVIYRTGRTAGESRLVLHSPIADLSPLQGQRVEVPWPGDTVAAF